MKKIALALVAAGLFAAPAFAQDMRIRAGENGVTIRADDGRSRAYRDRFDRRYGEERRWRRHDRDVRSTGSIGCRTVTVRDRLPNGDVVVRRTRHC
ncbi:MAG: hypothetical protein BGP06_11940 [Rhizobiales bacterium 65-9]|nr:hypothetical protein [Hyphomicrobiales bacterium]OJY33982.1 MAG: hypothetical protein BGP06_11940 [Rhizobiales bacterium 65-9]